MVNYGRNSIYKSHKEFRVDKKEKSKIQSFSKPAMQMTTGIAFSKRSFQI